MKLATKIIIALFVGAITGLLLNLFAPDVFKVLDPYLFTPLGQIFLNLIKMLVVPIVFFSITLGVAGLGDPKKLGRIGAKTITYFLLTTTFAIIIGISLALLIKPGAFGNFEEKDHTHCSFIDRCISTGHGSNLKTSHIKLWRTRHSRELFCLFHERRVYFAGACCCYWRDLDLNRVSEKRRSSLSNPAKNKTAHFSVKIHHTCADSHLFVCFYYVLAFLFGLIFFGTDFDERTGQLFQHTFAVIGSQWVEVINEFLYVFQFV
ncbi:Proton/glutamate-aspartate symporter [Bacillus safensis subsp. safensis]